MDLFDGGFDSSLLIVQVDLFVVRIDQRADLFPQPCFPFDADDNRFGDERHSVEVEFDLFRENVFPSCGDDQGFCPACDLQVAIGVDKAEIARAEPAVLGETGFSCLFIFVVTRKNVRPLSADFPDSRGVWFENLALDAREGRPYALMADFPRRGQVGARTCLGESVPLKCAQPKAVEESADLRVERSPGGEEVFDRPKSCFFAQSPEERETELQSGLLPNSGDPHHRFEKGLLYFSGVTDVSQDSRLHFFKEERDTAKVGDAVFADRRDDLGPREAWREGDCCSSKQWENETCGRFEAVVDGEDGKKHISRTRVEKSSRSRCVGENVTRGEHHTLRVAGRSRGVENRREIVEVERWQGACRTTAGFGYACECVGCVAPFVVQSDRRFQRRDSFDVGDQADKFCIRKENASAGIRKNVTNAGRRKHPVDRHANPIHRLDAEVRCFPLWAVFTEDRNGIARLDSPLDQPASDGHDVVVKSTVTPCFPLPITQNAHRGAVTKSLRATPG